MRNQYHIHSLNETASTICVQIRLGVEPSMLYHDDYTTQALKMNYSRLSYHVDQLPVAERYDLLCQLLHDRALEVYRARKTKSASMKRKHSVVRKKRKLESCPIMREFLSA